VKPVCHALTVLLPPDVLPLLLDAPASHLLVNLGISKFEIFEFSTSGYEISKEINKGVLGRPWTKRMVLIAISNTLKFQYFRKS